MTATDDVRAEREGMVARLLAQRASDHLAALAKLIETQAAEVARLREALREIDDLCPATQEVTTAHMMADIARAALQPRTPSHG